MCQPCGAEAYTSRTRSKRRAAACAADWQPDPREAHIARLWERNQRLTGKLARTRTEFNQLKEQHRLLLSDLAAKDDVLQRGSAVS
ncbi:hypothetical protein [Streptomyces sp. NPDC055400]